MILLNQILLLSQLCMLLMIITVSIKYYKCLGPLIYLTYLSIACVIHIIIQYIFIPILKYSRINLNSFLCNKEMNYIETGIYILNMYLFAEFIFIFLYLRSISIELKIFRKVLIYIGSGVICAYTFMFMYIYDKIYFQYLYLYLQMPIILIYSIILLLKSRNKYINSYKCYKSEFISLFGIIFLYASTFPSTYLFIYKNIDNNTIMIYYNIHASLIYLFFYIIIYKSFRCKIN